MRLAASNDDAAALRLRRLAQMLGQAARVAFRGGCFLGRGREQRLQHGGSAERHLGHDARAKRRQFRIRGAELVRRLLRGPHRHVHKLRHARQPARCRQHLRALGDGGHQLGLIVNQRHLALLHIQQHGLHPFCHNSRKAAENSRSASTFLAVLFEDVQFAKVYIHHQHKKLVMQYFIDGYMKKRKGFVP